MVDNVRDRILNIYIYIYIYYEKMRKNYRKFILEWARRWVCGG